MNAAKFVPDYTAPWNRYPILSFCPVAAFSADNTFHTPTEPTLPIVRHYIPLLKLLMQTLRQWSPGSLSRVGFHLLILLGIVLVYWWRWQGSNLSWREPAELQSAAAPLRRHLQNWRNMLDSNQRKKTMTISMVGATWHPVTSYVALKGGDSLHKRNPNVPSTLSAYPRQSRRSSSALPKISFSLRKKYTLSFRQVPLSQLVKSLAG